MSKKSLQTAKTIEHVLDCVGMRFRMRKEARAVLASYVAKRPLQVDLRREPSNRYDSNAVAVYGAEGVYDEVHLAYLRGPTAEVLAPKLDSGEFVVLGAELTRVYGKDDNEGEVAVVFEDMR